MVKSRNAAPRTRNIRPEERLADRQPHETSGAAPRRTSGHNEGARERILNAALQEFSHLGLAGARTDAIAKAAGVNKALLYYYFKNKDSLYRATLEQVAGRMVENAFASLDAAVTPGENLLRFVLHHFDRIATQREFQSLMQQEMVRFQRGESDAIPLLARSFYGPLLRKMEEVVREGIRTAELCEADWMQILYAALGANVFYFLTAPMMRMVVPFEPFAASALRERRKAAMEFLGSALFRDRNQGEKLARKVLAETPLPNPTVTVQGLLLRRRCS